MNAISIVAIGGLSLLFLSYFSGGLCMPDQPNGGAMCFHGFKALGIGNPTTTAPSGGSGGGSNCQFLGSGRVCWFGSQGQGCIKSNASSSDWQSGSGRNTLCSRARKAYLDTVAQAGGSRTAGPARRRHGPHTVLHPAASSFAMSYAAERLSVA